MGRTPGGCQAGGQSFSRAEFRENHLSAAPDVPPLDSVCSSPSGLLEGARLFEMLPRSHGAPLVSEGCRVSGPNHLTASPQALGLCQARRTCQLAQGEAVS